MAMFKFISSNNGCDKKKDGFSLTELIAVIVISAILAGFGIYLMKDFVQFSVVSPDQLTTDMIASEIMRTIMDGDSQLGGLRSLSKTDVVISDGNSGIVFSAVARDNLSNVTDEIAYTSENDNRLYRQVQNDPSTRQLIPINIPGGMGVNVVFTGIPNDDDPTLITVDVTVTSGSGSYESWGSRAQLRSSTVIRYSDGTDDSERTTGAILDSALTTDTCDGGSTTNPYQDGGATTNPSQ